jgi:sodium/hydrogen antiporter
MSVDTVLIIAGGAMLAIGLISQLIKRIWLSEVLLALVLGVVLGPHVLDIVDPRAHDERHVMEEVARVTLAIALMGTGLHLTRSDLLDNLRRSVSLLSGGMIGMWVLSGLGAWLLLDLPFWVGFLLGAILTPTDPVVAGALVTGPLAEHDLPRRLRRTLQIEAGANDGLALPFVLLAAYMATAAPETGLGDWAFQAAKHVGLAIVLGAAIGYVSSTAVEASLHHSETERPNVLGVGLAIALLTLGLVHLLGGSGILAVFVAALVFSLRLEDHVRREVESVQETITRFLILPAFILFGTILPLADWEGLGLAGVAFVAWILLLRRLPIVPVTLARSGTPRLGKLFLGWFGPLGIAAIYYATFVERYPFPEADTVFAAATLAVCASVLVHSLTATPAVRAYCRRSPDWED